MSPFSLLQYAVQIMISLFDRLTPLSVSTGPATVRGTDDLSPGVRGQCSRREQSSAAKLLTTLLLGRREDLGVQQRALVLLHSHQYYW